MRREPEVQHAARLHLEVKNGIVLVGSDAHIWPGQAIPPALRAFIKFTKELKPRAVIMNGDVMDFPQISKHSPIGWESHPKVKDELRAAKTVLDEIERSSQNSQRIWTLGNHDARFETRLAAVAAEYDGVLGVHLKDHFPKWSGCWSAWINNDVVVKHRFKGGAHAPHNNAVASGKTMVTGHLHSQKVSPWTDYTGTRYGVDTGCLADPEAKAFVDYTEDGPKNWVSGFGVLTFTNGKLLPPELVTVWGKNEVVFRGKLFKV